MDSVLQQQKYYFSKHLCFCTNIYIDKNMYVHTKTEIHIQRQQGIALQFKCVNEWSINKHPVNDKQSDGL